MNPLKLLPSRFLICVIATLSLLTGMSQQAVAANYISDDVYTFYHGGPSDQYRISGRIRSGTPVTVLSRDEKTKYIQIKTPSGRTGWISADKVSSGTSMATRFPKLQEQIKVNNAKLSQQEEAISSLKQESGTLGQENNNYAQQISTLEEEIVSLNRKINGMDESNLMRWFTYGGLVAFGGLILGLMIPYLPKRRKRHDTW